MKIVGISAFLVIFFFNFVGPVVCEEPPAWFVPVNAASETPEESKAEETSPAADVEESPPSWLAPEVTPKETVKEEPPPKTDEEEAPPSWLAPTGDEVTVTPEAEEPKLKISTPEVKKDSAFKDVPVKHWATSAVYDLVSLGITQGYPDGTFRGNKNITRYETAMFVSRLEKVINRQFMQAGDKRKKELKERRKKLKEELEKIKIEIESLKKPAAERPQYGVFISRFRAGNFTSQGSAFTSGSVGPKVDYRIIAGGVRKLSDNVELKVNFDTMDLGFGGGGEGAGEGFALALIDFEGDIKVSDVYSIKLTVGPGTIIHHEPLDGVVPSDDGIVFMRPKNSVGILAEYGDIYVRGGYKALSISSSGEASYSNMNLSFGRKFKEGAMLSLKDISLTFDFNFQDRLADPSDANVMKEKINMVFVPSEGFEVDAVYGMSAFMDASDNVYYGIEIISEDVIEEGTTFKFRINRAGSEYLNYPNYLAENDYIGANFFDKLIYSTSEGVADIGFEVIRNSGDLRLEARADVLMNGSYQYGKDFPDTNATFEIAIYKLSRSHSSIGLLYRIFHYPASAGLETSALIGLIAKYEF